MLRRSVLFFVGVASIVMARSTGTFTSDARGYLLEVYIKNSDTTVGS
jgi:hypothetical protein